MQHGCPPTNRAPFVVAHRKFLEQICNSFCEDFRVLPFPMKEESTIILFNNFPSSATTRTWITCTLHWYTGDLVLVIPEQCACSPKWTNQPTSNKERLVDLLVVSIHRVFEVTKLLCGVICSVYIMLSTSQTLQLIAVEALRHAGFQMDPQFSMEWYWLPSGGISTWDPLDIRHWNSHAPKRAEESFALQVLQICH